MVSRITGSLALAVALIATTSVAAFAQKASQKEEVRPLDVQRVESSQTFPYAVDANQQNERENILLLDLSNGGRVAIRLMPRWAPHHVERIKELARQGFYDGQIFHRVIDGFMAQTGDPTGTGQSGSKLPDLAAEFNDAPHLRGTVSMARTDDPNSANSQFFIVFYPRLGLDHKYTAFGRVIAGMDTVDAIQRGEPPANPTKILQASIAADNKPQVLPAAPVAAPAITSDMLRNSKSN
ncbi:peptidylprolyl isomerase [Novosphingobium sp. KCTC 2891]|uniref:peptidylprolyl isomerase n=1 Tax=Novosphingobium sp. KCTC 2891 TaxID=2989730 RepID=UPI002221D94D|nr:peptidylprolyl isomerase [Novosphingobium sp. KCTC 2891]MCW1381782.1 peptidylprolyl isomerase [Novosphingobium sp. KCTC 2891]